MTVFVTTNDPTNTVDDRVRDDGDLTNTVDDCVRRVE